MNKENVIKSIRIRTGKSVIERPIQPQYPEELYYESKATTSNTQENKTLKVNGEEFQLKKSAAAVAEQGISDIADSENL